MDLIKKIFRKYNYIIKLVVTILLLGYLFRKINIDDLVDIFNNTKYEVLVIPVLIYFISNIFSSLKWQKILLFYNINESVSYLYRLYLIGGFYNNFLPSTIGGDGYKYIKLHSKKHDKKAILSSIILERGIGYLSLFLICIPISFFCVRTIISSTVLIGIQFILFFLLTIPIIFILFSDSISKINFVCSMPIVVKFFRLVEIIKKIIPNKNLLCYAICQSLIFNLLSSLSLWFIFYSLNYSVDFLVVLYISSLVKIFSLIPLSLNNIGVTENIYVFLFSIFLVSPIVSLSVALIGRTISLICSLVGGFLVLYRSNIICQNKRFE